MALESVWKGLLVIAAVSIIGAVLVQAGFVSVPWGPDEGEVRIFDDGADEESTTRSDTGAGTATGANDGNDSSGGTDGGDAADGDGGDAGRDADADSSTGTGDGGTADRAGTEPKAAVDVEVADDRSERYTGLSDHDSLERGNGMLFVHNREQELTYVMREMDFDIDIIFIDADREITRIHHARAPEPGEDGNDLEYSGRGKWVLEVPRGYANETGIEVGDRVEIDLESAETAIFEVTPGFDALERWALVDPDSAPTAAVRP
ncbi:hypothetical protein A6E15_13960 [Natrinema saccharevitans]|uniref:DUF192 domain-containing protein n=1 Tax=Natrinema saccharevitans TaxID=301967 RepID=A0A1S8B070_9EURY|nr:DUF192 domain-containing protein [Natrinema saccharevitans]OLZ42014.1 hypothetical protein A6E15_13960 [Natrinema saccharevitans]